MISLILSVLLWTHRYKYTVSKEKYSTFKIECFNCPNPWPVPQWRAFKFLLPLSLKVAIKIWKQKSHLRHFKVMWKNLQSVLLNEIKLKGIKEGLWIWLLSTNYSSKYESMILLFFCLSLDIHDTHHPFSVRNSFES